MRIARYFMVFAVASSSVTLAADNPISRFLKPGLNPNDVPAEVFAEGAFLLGGRGGVWPGAPDFLLRMDSALANWPLSADGTPKLYARSAIFTDIGDAPDLALRRAGPDNAGPAAAPVALKSNVNIGALYWQSWGGRCKGDSHPAGFTAGCRNDGRNAAIYARTVGDQTGKNRAGSLHLATTPVGNPGNPIDRIEIASTGEVVINPDQLPVTLRVSRPSHNGETALLTAFQTNGRVRIDRVEVGPPNSCGKGYRCLRVSN